MAGGRRRGWGRKVGNTMSGAGGMGGGGRGGCFLVDHRRGARTYINQNIFNASSSYTVTKGQNIKHKQNQRNVIKAIALSPAKLDVQRHLVARDGISINDISRHRVQPCGRGRFSKRRLSAGRRRFCQVLLLGARETGGASHNDEYCVRLDLNLRLRQIQSLSLRSSLSLSLSPS